jgi:hypothetical protein
MLAAAVAVSVPLSLAVAATPASASPSCTTYKNALWNTVQSYNFGPGHWCMSDGDSKVVWQSDGNLVWYAVWDGHVLWASNTCTSCTWTSKRGANRLSFQIDGNIVVYANSTALWAIGASSRRTLSTLFHWDLYTIGAACNGYIKYALDHWQENPFDDLHPLERC